MDAQDRADTTLTMARVIRERLNFGQELSDIRDDLVPNFVSNEDFFLAYMAAKVLSS